MNRRMRSVAYDFVTSPTGSKEPSASFAGAAPVLDVARSAWRIYGLVEQGSAAGCWCKEARTASHGASMRRAAEQPNHEARGPEDGPCVRTPGRARARLGRPEGRGGGPGGGSAPPGAGPPRQRLSISTRQSPQKSRPASRGSSLPRLTAHNARRSWLGLPGRASRGLPELAGASRSGWGFQVWLGLPGLAGASRAGLGFQGWRGR